MLNTLLHPLSFPKLCACQAWSCSGQRFLYENSCIHSSLQTKFNPQMKLKSLHEKRLLNHRRNVIWCVTRVLVWTTSTKQQGRQKFHTKTILPVHACQAFLWTELSLQTYTWVRPWELIIKKHDSAEKPLLSLKAELFKKYSYLFLWQKVLWGEKKQKLKRKPERGNCEKQRRKSGDFQVSPTLGG